MALHCMPIHIYVVVSFSLFLCTFSLYAKHMPVCWLCVFVYSARDTQNITYLRCEQLNGTAAYCTYISREPKYIYTIEWSLSDSLTLSFSVYLSMYMCAVCVDSLAITGPIHTNVNKARLYVKREQSSWERNNISTYDLAVSSIADFAWNSCKFNAISGVSYIYFAILLQLLTST